MKQNQQQPEGHQSDAALNPDANHADDGQDQAGSVCA
eukprot:CAMPEP_0185856408 /NCGR_PEP_ID=MMETSP1354-20130828/28950_1 /TAXON_ID=708628 /ORGANISM="Erythrolobus madagascarensis, Strain CCMP3276" /LENGTH=36 /DNA_ID= /DNA_START= /DNA_END= /DNA_ORIENTATION=